MISYIILVTAGLGLESFVESQMTLGGRNLNVFIIIYNFACISLFFCTSQNY